MLHRNLEDIGNALYKIRKSKGLTQAELAEKAELSDRAYADIERGNTDMRVTSLIKICQALRATPNEILTKEGEENLTEEQFVEAIRQCTEKEQRTALQLLRVYLDSLNV